mmetsp:Transcript_18641/g.52411  ORF Transcript_18641/g.52411 Transcript_18641/m.52411 type:complete len:255 (-) Transcript_18641:257-1021(-)
MPRLPGKNLDDKQETILSSPRRRQQWYTASGARRTHNLVGLLGLAVHGLGQEVGEFLQWRLGVLGLAPQVRGQETIGLGQSKEGGLDEVAQGLAGAGRGGVAVLNTSHLQHLLGHTGSYDTSTSGSGHQADGHGTALAGDLGGHGVHLSDLVTPVAAAHGHHGHLGLDDGATDGGGHLLGTLHAQTDVAVEVTHHHKSLEAGPLTSAGLLLHRHDLHDLILQRGAKEVVHNLALLDGHGEQVNLLQALDFALLH